MNGENAIHWCMPLYYIRGDSERNEAYSTGNAGATWYATWTESVRELGVWLGVARAVEKRELLREDSFGKARDLVSWGQCVRYLLYYRCACMMMTRPFSSVLSYSVLLSLLCRCVRGWLTTGLLYAFVVEVCAWMTHYWSFVLSLLCSVVVDDSLPVRCNVFTVAVWW